VVGFTDAAESIGSTYFGNEVLLPLFLPADRSVNP